MKQVPSISEQIGHRNLGWGMRMEVRCQRCGAVWVMAPGEQRYCDRCGAWLYARPLP